MQDYDRNLWKTGRASKITADNPDMIMMRSSHKKNPKAFPVNKALLCYYSPFYQTLFYGPFKEAQESTTSVEVDVSQVVLRVFHGWMNTGKILLYNHPDISVDLYTFADSLGCIALKRAAISHLHTCLCGPEGHIHIIPYQTLTKIWNTSLKSSSLYRYVLDTFVFHWHHGMDENVDDPVNKFGIPADFLYKILIERSVFYQQILSNGIGWGGYRCCSNICAYHEHPDEEERSATCGSFREILIADTYEEDRSDEEDEHAKEEDVQKNKNGDAAGDKRKAYDNHEEASVKRSKLTNGA